jgi:CheY-like chemotaxis protein
LIRKTAIENEVDSESFEALAPPPGNVAVCSTRILVVDDNADSADLVAGLLTAHGYVVHVEHSGTNALLSVERVSPHVALLDIRLPDMDGHELARELRSRFGGAIGLVALTGYGRERDRVASEIAGFDVHLVKPASISVILETIAKLRE